MKITWMQLCRLAVKFKSRHTYTYELAQRAADKQLANLNKSLTNRLQRPVVIEWNSLNTNVTIRT